MLLLAILIQVRVQITALIILKNVLLIILSLPLVQALLSFLDLLYFLSLLDDPVNEGQTIMQLLTCPLCAVASNQALLLLVRGESLVLGQGCYYVVNVLTGFPVSPICPGSPGSPGWPGKPLSPL